MTEAKPNRFNFSFLQLPRLKPISLTTKTLRFSESAQPIDASVSMNRKVTYTLEGSDMTRITNESNLYSKVTACPDEDRPRKRSVIEIHDDEKPEEEQIIQKPTQVSRRYFAPIDTTTELNKCRRCGEYGHLQRTCTKTVKQSCFYCMGRHHVMECQQLTCMRCNENGHKAKDCQYNNGRCYKCGKYGHRENTCESLIVYEDFNNGNFQATDLQRMKCLTCRKKGHINCTKFKGREDNLYAIYRQQTWEQMNRFQRSSSKRGQKTVTKDRTRTRVYQEYSHEQVQVIRSPKFQDDSEIRPRQKRKGSINKQRVIQVISKQQRQMQRQRSRNKHRKDSSDTNSFNKSTKKKQHQVDIKGNKRRPILIE